MAAPRFGHAGEAVEPIADHGTAGRQGFLGELLDLLATEAFDPAQLDPDGLALVGGLYRGDEWCFSRCSPAAFSARSFTAQIGIIHLDPAAQGLVLLALQHDLEQLVLEFPCGVRRHAQPPGQFQGGRASLRLREMVHGRKPLGQRQLAGVEDRPGCQRSLMPASPTLEKVARLDQRIVTATARRAGEPIRPAHLDDSLPAEFLGSVLGPERRLAEPLLKLDRVSSHQKTLRRQPIVLLLYHQSAAEESA